MLATAVLTGDPLTDAEDLHATACAVYAVLLGATERGLASYWRTPAAFAEPAVREALQLGADERVVALIHLGPKVSDPPEKERLAARRPAQRSAVVPRTARKSGGSSSPGSSNASSRRPLSSSVFRNAASGRWLIPTRDLIPVSEKFRDSRLPAGEPVLRMQERRLARSPLDRREPEARMDAE